MYKAKTAVCPESRTKHWTQSEHHVDFLNVKADGKGKKYPLNAEIQAHSLSYCLQSRPNEGVFVKVVLEIS